MEIIKLLLLVLCCCIVFAKNKKVLTNVPSKLDDGLLVIKGGDIATQSASWTVLITIDEPKRNIELENAFLRIKRLIAQANNLSNITGADYLSYRIDNLLLRCNRVDCNSSRQKRGLFNFIGSFSHSLFGLATDDQIADCQESIAEVSQVNKRVSHSVSRLLTVVNQSIDHINSNSEHISQLHDYVVEVEGTAEKFHALVKQEIDFLHSLAFYVRLTSVVNNMQTVYESWLRQVDLFNRQRAELELGYLTEEMLPVVELSKILVNAAKFGVAPLPVEWYYSNTKVVPLWDSSDRLVFQATLPFVDEKSYLRYFLWSFPVPISANDEVNSDSSEVKGKVLSHIQAPGDLALDTHTGELFFPHNCVGQSPVVCRPGPFYMSKYHKCARGIINGDDELRKTCQFSISPVNSTETIITELAPAFYIIRTLGEAYTIHCAGKPETRSYLPMGVYSMYASSTCRISGNGWFVSGYGQRALSVHQIPKPLYVRTLNLTEFIPMKFVYKHFDHLKWSPTAAPLKLDVINPPSEQWQSYEKFVEHSRHVNWVVVLFVILLLVACIGILKVLHDRNLLPKCVKTNKTADERQGDIFLKELQQEKQPVKLIGGSFRLPKPNKEIMEEVKGSLPI